MLPQVIAPSDWPALAPGMATHLARMAAGSGGRFHPEDIAAAICAGRMQAWVARDGPDIGVMLVTEIAQYPRLRALRLIGCVGTRAHRWGRLWPFVEAVARDWGCTRLEALTPGSWPMGRRGWSMFHVLWERPI